MDTWTVSTVHNVWTLPFMYLDTFSEVGEDRRLGDRLKTFHLPSRSGEVD